MEHNRLDPLSAAEIIQDQFPDLWPASTRYLGEGYDSTAFEVNGDWVFRFPKRDEVEQQLLLEFNVLPVLVKGSPIPVPAFRFRGQPSSAFPRHFVGYPKLPGEPAIGLEPDAVPISAWTPKLAKFLSWLHAFPTDKATRLGVERQDITSLIDEFKEDALSEFENLNRVATDQPLDEWHAYLTEGPGTVAEASSATVLVHGDLAAEHVLYDPATDSITGIIDWSEMALCDSSLDLAALFHWGGRPLVDAVLSTYEGVVDEAVLRRARFLASCRGVGDVTFGLETGRHEYVNAGVRALVLCIGGHKPLGRATESGAGNDGGEC